MQFNHLHVHTMYSKLDGMGTVQELLEKAQRLGHSAMAITDHGTCSGLYDLFKFAPQYGIKPIYGCEFYLKLEEEEKRNHLVLLAKDQEGLENIFALHEWSYVNGFHTKPCITYEVLKQHTKGIICLSACLANIIPRSIVNGYTDTAERWAKNLKGLFGDDFFLEIQDSPLPEQQIANMGVVKLAKRLDIPFVATNDVHYTDKSDAPIHDTMLCMQINAKKKDPKRWRFPSDTYYFKSAEEMLFEELSPNDRVTALNTTQVIVERCHATLVKGKYLPKFYDVPEGLTEEQLLRKKVTERYKTEIQAKGLHSKDYVDAVMHELDVIEQTGYSGYHLIVSDFVNYARNNNILVGDGRGSGAGCKVAYILGITRVEPTKHHLLFERFLAPGREPD